MVRLPFSDVRAALGNKNLVRRVRKTALHLARAVSTPARTPDFLTVEVAALLHDVLDKKYVSPEASADPYAYFLPFFEKLRSRAPTLDLVADGRARDIARIVENVSWTTEKKLRAEGAWGAWHESCIELHCVQDADRLDAIGAFGMFWSTNSCTNRYIHCSGCVSRHHALCGFQRRSQPVGL